MTESERIALPLIEKLIAYRDGISRSERSDRELLADACNTISSLRATCSDLRTTLSRQAELLGLAAKALKPFADGLQFYRDDSIDNETFLDWSENIKVGDLRTASSTLDAIRDELKGDANGE